MTTYVHLVGSVALDTAQDVSDAVGYSLVPLRLADASRPTSCTSGSSARPAKRARPTRIFSRRGNGDLTAEVPCQVSLPTPLAVINPFCTPEDAPRILPVYAQAMLREVGRICEAIPHADLAIQWDVCIEMLMWDGRRSGPLAPEMRQVFGETFARLAAAVPDDVELGFHLCYGDMDARHTLDPQDAGKAVELANCICASVKRPVTWIHRPVPIDRCEDAYFQPRTQLERPPGTELHLGPVHAGME